MEIVFDTNSIDGKWFGPFESLIFRPYHKQIINTSIVIVDVLI